MNLHTISDSPLEFCVRYLRWRFPGHLFQIENNTIYYRTRGSSLAQSRPLTTADIADYTRSARAAQARGDAF